MNTPGKAYDRCVSFYEREIQENRTFTNMIVLDELLYMSKKKYGVPFETTMNFIDSVVIPFTSILELELDDYYVMKEMLRFCPKPSDALIAASMKRASIDTLLSEDKDFDKVPHINRRWLHG
jgi:hypothetical protein